MQGSERSQGKRSGYKFVLICVPVVIIFQKFWISVIFAIKHGVYLFDLFICFILFYFTLILTGTFNDRINELCLNCLQDSIWSRYVDIILKSHMRRMKLMYKL